MRFSSRNNETIRAFVRFHHFMSEASASGAAKRIDKLLFHSGIANKECARILERQHQNKTLGGCVSSEVKREILFSQSQRYLRRRKCDSHLFMP